MSIRNAPPASLASLLIESARDIPARIAAVIASHEAPPLYSRHWMNFSSPPCEDSNATGSSRSPTFRVMQFNMLAEGLSAHPDNKPPFNEDVDGSVIAPSTCGGFDFDCTARGVKLFDFHEYRKWRLLEEILSVDADVIALEEIDHFPDFFEPILASLGYTGLFQPKKESPCTQFGYYSDGVAVFWKNAVFDSAGLSPLCANDASPSIVQPLRHRFTERVIVFAATHLKSKASDVNEQRRVDQITALLGNAADAMSASGTPSLVLLGDFNTDAFSVPKMEAKVIPLVMSWNGGCLSHTYSLPSDASCDQYSTWKSRAGKSVKHWIDYIFYSHSNLRVNRVLGPPVSDEINASEHKLPNLRYPSDHISIAADMTIIL